MSLYENCLDRFAPHSSLYWEYCIMPPASRIRPVESIRGVTKIEDMKGLLEG
jgi:hypothetical protein